MPKKWGACGYWKDRLEGFLKKGEITLELKKLHLRGRPNRFYMILSIFWFFYGTNGLSIYNQEGLITPIIRSGSCVSQRSKNSSWESRVLTCFDLRRLTDWQTFMYFYQIDTWCYCRLSFLKDNLHGWIDSFSRLTSFPTLCRYVWVQKDNGGKGLVVPDGGPGSR